MGEDPEGAKEDSELSDNSDEEDARAVRSYFVVVPVSRAKMEKVKIFR